jgi:hypothetical protein
MNDNQQAMLTEALGLLNRTIALVDMVYEQSEQARDSLPPGPERDEKEEALGMERGALTIILGDIEGAANDILEMLGFPRLPSSPRFMGPRRLKSV